MNSSSAKYYSSTEKQIALESSLIGGKASNLFVLQSLGLPVPRFVVIPYNNKEINAELVTEILHNFEDNKLFAVRSSATDEDGSQFSFAGQFETFLYVKPSELLEKINHVIASANSERIRVYREQNNLAPSQGIAVIIQEMIEADAAGVAFGINPTTGARNEKVVSSVWGLGEGLVSGELDADTFLVNNKGIESKIAHKENRIVWDNTKGSGTIQTSVDIDKQLLPSLSEKLIHEIAATLDKLKAHYGKPQDIEFAVRDGQLFMLQARPVTNLGNLQDKEGEHIVWDNSNIIESYPGVTTPLTFSFIIKMYEAVYVQLSALLGVSEKEIDASKEVFANMLGLLNGRVYYNLLSWYKALALLPGYALNAEFMERMMGVKERFELKDYKPKSKFTERLRVLKMVWTMIRNFRQLKNMRISFQREFNEVMKEYDEIDLNSKQPEELMVLYNRFEQTLLKKWKAPLVNDFFAMIFFGVTQKLTEKYGLPKGIHNDLLCGARDIISTEPIKWSLQLSTDILQDENAKAIFLRTNTDELWNKMTIELPNIKEKFDAYIQKFGERCVGELKLETITYKQDPTTFVRIIQGYVRQGVTNGVQSNIDEEMRHNAEQKVNETLRGKPLKKMMFRYFLSRARVLVSARENLRFERTRGFGKVREIFCAIGKQFYSEGIILNERDIFYLTKEEIFDYIKGTAVTQDITSLIALRQSRYHEFESKKTSERIDTYGSVYHANSFYEVRHKGALQGDMQGLGCCPGRVKARVQVVHDPREVEDLNGDILVTSSTDPGWVTLFPTASAILVERGSLLSHSAIVSREMGKPCIVGITGLLDRLKTGDTVEMDGTTGVVQIIAS